MYDGRPSAKDSTRDDRGLTEAIAQAHGDNAKDAYRQVGKTNLELEGDYRSASRWTPRPSPK